MPRYAALLRDINVGGHTVKMDALRSGRQLLTRTGHELLCAAPDFRSRLLGIVTGRLDTLCDLPKRGSNFLLGNAGCG